MVSTGCERIAILTYKFDISPTAIANIKAVLPIKPYSLSLESDYRNLLSPREIEVLKLVGRGNNIHKKAGGSQQEAGGLVGWLDTKFLHTGN
jgi:hypothetical protein